MAVKPFLIPAALNLAMSQRLVRVLCAECKEKIKAEGQVLDFLLEKVNKMPKSIKEQLKLKEPFYIYQPKGCKKCNFKGYSGRKGIFEIIRMSNELARIINHEPSEQAIFQAVREQGMITMEEEGVIRVLGGETSLEEIVGITEEE
jgi:type II secretory ATPase GspE/PulE/Tfp pilus assembly ATPase PilB-like protein